MAVAEQTTTQPRTFVRRPVRGQRRGFALLIIAMTITGAAMWWVRRPPGRTGFMPLPVRYRWPTWCWIAIALAAISMPLFALSIVAVAGIEGVGHLLRGRRPSG